MTRPMIPWLTAAVVSAAAFVSGCNTLGDQLARAEKHYQDARYESALTNLEDMEYHLGELNTGERVRYDLVRGMTHFRLEQRTDARHWLAIAREESKREPSALSDEARANIERILAETDPLSPHPAAASSGGAAGGSSGGAAPSGGAQGSP